MAVTDLTETKWKLNTSINSISNSTSYSFNIVGNMSYNEYSRDLPFTTGSYNYTDLTLSSNTYYQSNWFTWGTYGGSSGDRNYTFKYYGPDGPTGYTNTWVWERYTGSTSRIKLDNARPILSITGGTDVTNTRLINWLLSNAEQIPAGYSITYHANGGTPEPENLTGQTSLPSPLPTVSKPNFTFDGWYLDSTFQTPAVAGAEISADTDLYAKFTRTHIALDLSTIGLPVGAHSIQMKLSDDDITKADSELSNAVTYTQYQ